MRVCAWVGGAISFGKEATGDIFLSLFDVLDALESTEVFRDPFPLPLPFFLVFFLPLPLAFAGAAGALCLKGQLFLVHLPARSNLHGI